MATPFPGQPDTVKDAYNFFHSQLRIRIECAFGMLVSWRGILRKIMPCNIAVAKVPAIVLCLCRLHNFCIDEEGETITTSVGGRASYSAPTNTPDNALELAAEGIHLENTQSADSVPRQLLGSGHHFNDHPNRNQRRAITRRAQQVDTLPRDKLLVQIREAGYRCLKQTFSATATATVSWPYSTAGHPCTE